MDYSFGDTPVVPLSKFCSVLETFRFFDHRDCASISNIPVEMITMFACAVGAMLLFRMITLIIATICLTMLLIFYIVLNSLTEICKTFVEVYCDFCNMGT